MSGFPNWMQGLQGLFNNQQSAGGFNQFPGGRINDNGTLHHGAPALGSPQHFMSRFGTPGYTGPQHQSPFMGGNAFTMGQNFQPQYFAMPSNSQQGGMTYGHLIAGGLQQDRNATEAARQHELSMMQGLFGQQMGMNQGYGQMVQQAQQGQQQGMDLMFQQARNVNAAGQQMQDAFGQAQRQAQQGLSQTWEMMSQSMNTMRSAIQNMDFFRKDTVSSLVAGVQQQYQNSLNEINRNDSLTPEQKEMMTSEIRMGMQRESAGIASQADQQAAMARATMEQNLGQMQASLASNWGSLSTQTALGLGSLGAQVGQAQQQAQLQLQQFYAGVDQFNRAQIQSSMATALDLQSRGLGQAAQLIQMSPFGQASLSEMIARQVLAIGADRTSNVDPRIMSLFA